MQQGNRGQQHAVMQGICESKATTTANDTTHTRIFVKYVHMHVSAYVVDASLCCSMWWATFMQLCWQCDARSGVLNKTIK